MNRIVVLYILFLLTALDLYPQKKEFPEPGSAHIWYLGHCGYAVRTPKHLLIFDYQEFRDGQQQKTRPSAPSLENGWINPEEVKNLAICVFASHSHDDHFDPVIFKWKEKIPDIRYFFGWKAAEDTSFHYLIGPRAVYKSGGLEIATINSNHSGVPEVAWLVKVDGFVIYHNGDCQPMDAVSEYEILEKYTRHIDIAFVPPTTDEKWKYTKQNMELFKTFSPEMVFPIHATAGDQMYKDFAKEWKKKSPELNIITPGKLGELFIYSQEESKRQLLN